MASSHEINDRLRLYNLSIRVGEGYRTSGTHPPVRPPLMVCRLSPFSSRNLLLCVWERVCVCVYDLQIKKKKEKKIERRRKKHRDERREIVKNLNFRKLSRVICLGYFGIFFKVCRRFRIRQYAILRVTWSRQRLWIISVWKQNFLDRFIVFIAS